MGEPHGPCPPLPALVTLPAMATKHDTTDKVAEEVEVQLDANGVEAHMLHGLVNSARLRRVIPPVTDELFAETLALMVGQNRAEERGGLWYLPRE